MLNNLGPVGKLVGTATLIDAKVFSVGGRSAGDRPAKWAQIGAASPSLAPCRGPAAAGRARNWGGSAPVRPFFATFGASVQFANCCRGRAVHSTRTRRLPGTTPRCHRLPSATGELQPVPEPSVAPRTRSFCGHPTCRRYEVGSVPAWRGSRACEVPLRDTQLDLARAAGRLVPKHPADFAMLSVWSVRFR